MIRNQQRRTTTRSQATQCGRKPKGLLASALIACVALVVGAAFNVALASVKTADGEAPAAAPASHVPSQAASTARDVVKPLVETGDVAASAGALVSAVANQAALTAGETAPPTIGQVVVFEIETRAMTAFDDPGACNNAPALAHTIMNFTSEDITLFADDRCGIELIDVRPGFGSHVAPGQSFAAIG